MATGRKINYIKWIGLGFIAYFVFTYAKSALNASNLKPLVKDLRFKIIDVFNSKLQIDLSLFNADTNPVSFQNITSDVYIDNNYIGFIAYNSNQTIPANAYGYLNLEINVSNLQTATKLYDLVQAILGGNKVTTNIKFDGKLTVDGKYLPLSYNQPFTFNQNKVSGFYTSKSRLI